MSHSRGVGELSAEHNPARTAAPTPTVRLVVGYAFSLIHWAIPASRSRSNSSTVG